MQNTREGYEERALHALQISEQWLGGNMTGAQVLATQALAFATLALAAETEEVD